MILSTTNTIEGKTVKNYLGIVSGTTYSSTFITKDLSFKDMFKKNKYKEAYENAMEDAKEGAFQKLKANADRLKANAILGITLDMEHIANSTYWMVTVVGTAVEVH